LQQGVVCEMSESVTPQMRILWLSNMVLSEQDAGTSGTWLSALAQELVSSGRVDLGNISIGNVAHTCQQDYGSIRQWVVPSSAGVMRNGLPAERTVTEIINAVEEYSPDLVHVWGTESYWGLLTARKLIKHVSLLETQGLKFSIAKVYQGGLSVKEQLACVGIKEILRRSMIYQMRRRFEKWGLMEKEIIAHHLNIGVQTEWVESQVKTINRTCNTYNTDLALRVPFYKALPWEHSGNFRVFCSAAYPAPFKGLHVAIRALAILKYSIPYIRLRIAGALQRQGIRQDGYVSWLNKEVEKHGVASNVEWLGSLDAAEIVEELKTADAMLLPSYIENCSNAMQEAMMVGTPVVSSYTGGLPSLAKDGESALFFPPGDEAMCANRIERVLTERELAERLSKKAREVAEKRSDPEKIVSRQLEIYRQIISAGASII
jgi:L-malate glycosyltransferase